MTKVEIACEGPASQRGAQTPKLRVLAAMREASGGDLKVAVAGYRNEQFAAFDSKTAKTLAK